MLVTSSRRLVERSLGVILKASSRVRVASSINSKASILGDLRGGIPSIVLVSIEVPGVSKAIYAGRIGGGCPSIGVVVLAAFSSSSFVCDTLGCNTSKCVLGKVSVRKLGRTVVAIRHNNSVVGPSVTAGIIELFSRVTRSSFTVRISRGNSSRLAGSRGVVVRHIKRKLSGGRVTNGLCLSRKAIEGGVSEVLSGLNLHSEARLTV